ncbi:MAG: DHHW family protein [Butyrivibrio sp.]|nr:DHHW family protein [Butyrivibrio sp.]
MGKDQYNNAGLLNGQKLSDELLEDKKYVIYPDRVFLHFDYHRSYADQSARLGNALKKAIGTCRLYIMPAPMRVFTEETGKSDLDNYTLFMEEIGQHLNPGIYLVDTFPDISAHQDEYVFFRTENSWTARGAYYGCRDLFELMGKDIPEIEKYNEYMFRPFWGTTRHECKEEYSKDSAIYKSLKNIEEDPLYFYLSPKSENREEIVEENSAGEMIRTKKPMITTETVGLGAFVGNDYEYAIVDGKGAKTILVICDRTGNVMVPFLADEFRKVYVINIERADVTAEEIRNIIKEYEVSDVLWVQNVLRMGDGEYCKVLNSIISDEMENEK